MSDRVYVYSEMPNGEQKLAGVFVAKNGDGFFKYHPDWIKKGYPISFDLPISDHVHQKNKDINQGVFGSLRDAMPDFWGRLVASKSLNKPFEHLGVIDLMLSTDGFSQVGGLTFHATKEYREPLIRPPKVVDLSLLCDAAAMVEKNIKDIPPEYLYLLQQGSSMGGARPKTTIMNNGVMQLVKLPSYRDQFSNAGLENACLTLAQICGLVVPNHSVLTIDGFGDVLLLDRFDRIQSGRLPYQSGLSLLNLDESENVMGGYPALSIEMRKQAMNDGDSKRLFKHMAFNAFIRNTDDHLRNHGFLMVNGKWTLSPLFDLAPSPALAGVGREFFSSINIGENGRISSLDNLLSSSHSFLLDKEDALSIVHEMSLTISRNWQDVFAKNDVDADLFSGCFDNDLHEQLDKSARAYMSPTW